MQRYSIIVFLTFIPVVSTQNNEANPNSADTFYMSTLSFNHLALSVKNVDASIEFYQRVLHLQEIENTASNSRTRWLSLGAGQQLHLIYRPEEEIIVTQSVHFALATDDIDSVIEHLVDLGIEYFDWSSTPNKIEVRSDGFQQIYFQDPDGYWIEINNVV